MATLVLTAVGSAIGGPIGAAVGAIVGQRIDQEIFKPKGRHGPRLSDLKVQTSSYGAPIPKLFGTMRVAGTVIWATDLREERKKSGGGKGRPSTTSYSYSASFAVLLSARPILGVRRIWADGNLLRGAAGDFKTSTGFRLHLGSEDQAPDPLIASAEGLATTPAYRGCAYAVFENLALADFGNRIPSLTFEVEADATPLAIGAIINAIGAPDVAGAAARTLSGFAALGDSLRGVIETLDAATQLALLDEGDRLLLSDAPPIAAPIAERDRETEDGGRRRESRSIAPALALPSDLTISYYEPTRDYQAGLQRARRPGPGRRGERLELPAALSAGEAKSIAEIALARAWTERETHVVRLPWRRLDLIPGARVDLEGDAGAWRVAKRTIERSAIELELVRHRAASTSATPATPGRAIAPPDRTHGPTVIHVLDLPPLTDELLAAPRLFIAAAGPSSGWRRAALAVSLDDGARWEPIGGSAAPAVIGEAVGVLRAAGSAIIDSVNSVEIELLNEAMALTDADEGGLIAGANLALLGDELIQYGRATPLGDRRWRLERLVRGRRGTEWAIGGHAAGERFVLIEPEALLAYDPPASAMGGEARVIATGVGDGPAGVEAAAAIGGAAVRPPAPVGLSARVRSDGGYDLLWTRRSRAGWRWLDSGDASLAEEAELYAVSFVRGDGSTRTVESRTPGCDYPATDVAQDIVVGASVSIEVRQMGSLGASRPARLALAIG